jgi:type I restriction enzyme S subunit
MEILVDKLSLNKYQEYIDSGIDWLGDIPKHWNLLANKYIFKLKKNQVGKRSKEYTLLSLTLNGVIKRDMENPQGKFPAEFDTYQEVKQGDFIFCLFDVEETPRCIGLSDFNGMITGAYTVLECKSKFDNKYLYYFYLNLDSDKRLRPLYTGLRNTISKENFFSFKTFLPPLPEQTAIANFLDRKTALIDQAISIKEKQIELLKERKQILIQKAVTRGLNPNVKLKDSGVEWIGEIPEHWEVLPGLRFFKENNRKNIGMVEDRVLSLSYGKIIIKPLEKLVGLVPESFETYQIVFPNDIIIRCTDLQNDQTSLRTGIAKDKGIITSAYLNFSVLNSNNAEYYHYYLYSLDLTKVLYKYGSGLRQNLTFIDFKRMPVLQIPISEQILIVDFIKKTELKVEETVGLKLKEIEKLKEYKSTLVNSAVTGKIKVC